MTNYAILLQEAIANAAFPKASKLIQSYLKKHLGTTRVYLYPEPEHFKSGGRAGVGIRYFINAMESVRFNWLSDTSVDTSKNLMSVDYWDGHGHGNKPSYRMTFDKSQSLVKSLPLIVNFIQTPVMGDTLWVEESNIMESAVANMNASFSTIIEARASGGNILPTISNVIRAFSQGLNLKDMRNDSSIGTGYDKVVMAARELYPQFFEKQGVSVVFSNKHNATKLDAGKLAAKLGIQGVSAKVSVGGVETIIAPAAIETMEENLPRICYEEQLDDLRRAMVLLMSNATQSLYLGGRGGVGKTAVVEEELHKRGLSDGEGYFKITGSASTAGIYRILYIHRKDILLFDDSDGALADQDSRNLFKAASDTKKVRKIAWMKAGKNYVDPDDIDEDDEDSDPDILPRYFDFTGKIIFISNLKLDKLDPDGALSTRVYVLNIDPTDEEVYNYMGKIVDKIKLDVDHDLTSKQRQEVIDILRTRRLKEGGANLRQLVRGLNTMAGILAGGGTDYHNMILRYA
jgi:hypothetical protein